MKRSWNSWCRTQQRQTGQLADERRGGVCTWRTQHHTNISISGVHSTGRREKQLQSWGQRRWKLWAARNWAGGSHREPCGLWRAGGLRTGVMEMGGAEVTGEAMRRGQGSLHWRQGQQKAKRSDGSVSPPCQVAASEEKEQEAGRRAALSLAQPHSWHQHWPPSFFLLSCGQALSCQFHLLWGRALTGSFYWQLSCPCPAFRALNGRRSHGPYLNKCPDAVPPGEHQPAWREAWPEPSSLALW